jgi:hypothetical protein
VLCATRPPSLKYSLDLLQEGRPLLGVGMVHIVIGEVVVANGVAGYRTHQAFHHSLGRVPKQETGRATGAISAASLRSFCKFGTAAPSGSIVKLTGNEDAVEEALQDRGEPLVPNWIYED